MNEKALSIAVDYLKQADALLITAGAGMGVDSGLPDFRGNEGLWRAYPALQHAGMDFREIANPAAFMAEPRLAWGFYGHRLHLYRRTVPHGGFHILKRWAERYAHGAFVSTSNVDGQFQMAGFDPNRIVECHGSIHYLQCMLPCDSSIWSADRVRNPVDEEECLMMGELPRCPLCGGIARPNILMFGDWRWLEGRTEQQMARYRQWREQAGRVVVVEVGAGISIPTVRHFSEDEGDMLIRINPREARVPKGQCIGIAMTALAALQLLDERLMS